MTVIPNPARQFFTPRGTVGASAALTSGTAYFTYIGFFAFSATIQFVEVMCGTLGSGGQTAEIGLFTTTAPPNKGNQSLTKLVATGTVDTLSGGGSNVVKRNTNPFAQVVAAATFLWAGIRTAMATTQPTFIGWCGDQAEGWVLTTAASGVLTGAGPFAGVIPSTAVGGGTLSPAAVAGLDMRATLD